MTQSNCTTAKRTFKHLTDIQRGRLEEMAKEGDYTQAKMAKELNSTQSTISRELKRGRTRQMASNRTYYDRYLADAGSRVYHDNRWYSHARDHHKYSEKFLKELPKAIVSTKKKPREHSVDTFVHTYRKEHPNEQVPCTKTVYTLIDKGVLPIRNIDLPMKTRIRPLKKHRSDPKGTNAKHLGRSIEERDPSVLSREELGHWEADLVLGKKTKDEPVILTLVERKTRYALALKLEDSKSQTIFDDCQSVIKSDPKSFKSITFDNGSEFSKVAELETDELSIYFCHAYSAWERGSNENFNKLLREFIPKGKSLHHFTNEEVILAAQSINQRVREVNDYQSAEETYKKMKK